MRFSVGLLATALVAGVHAAGNIVKATITADELIINQVETPVTFHLTNVDPEPILLAAFGGSFKDPATNATYNLTNVKIEPPQSIPGNGGTIDVLQSVKIDLGPADYLVNFVLYGQHGQEFVALHVEERMFTVKDADISSWDYRLIFSETVIAATFAILGYLVSTKYVLPWIESKLPAQEEKVDNAKVKMARGKFTKGDKKAKKDEASSTGYDESWIPEHHLKKKTK